jgi:dihydroxy-acid dehydratase
MEGVSMSSSTKAGAGQDRFVSANPGRDVQRVGTARFLGQDPLKIHEPVWAVTGNLGDSQCYLGVTRKVEAIHSALAARINRATRLQPTRLPSSRNSA